MGGTIPLGTNDGDFGDCVLSFSRHRGFPVRVSVPAVAVYFFEVTPRSTRLLYYLPRRKLQSLVKRQSVSAEALLDFPYGLEVEVNDLGYAILREQYHFEARVSAAEAWNAFRGFYLAVARAGFPRSGWIDADTLEEYALSLHPLFRESDTAFSQAWSDEVGETTTRAALRGALNRAQSRRRDQLLAEHPPPRTDPEAPFQNQPWANVRMTSGVSVAAMFAAIQSARRPRGDGNRA
jgi:hypothetical protein